MPKKSCNNCAKYSDRDIKIARLDEQMIETKDFIRDIKDNHLPHIYKELNSINLKLAYWSGAIIVLGATAQILINKLL